MVVCYNCGKEMKCKKNGLGVRYQESHVYAGDLFECVCCNIKVIKTTDNAFHDSEKTYPTITGHEQNEQCEYCYNKKHPYIGEAPCGEIPLGPPVNGTMFLCFGCGLPMHECICGTEVKF